MSDDMLEKITNEAIHLLGHKPEDYDLPVDHKDHFEGLDWTDHSKEIVQAVRNVTRTDQLPRIEGQTSAYLNAALEWFENTHIPCDTEGHSYLHEIYKAAKAYSERMG